MKKPVVDKIVRAAGLTACVAIVGTLGVVGSARADEQMVWDPDLQETVPLELQGALRDASVFANAGSEDATEVNFPPSDPMPAAYGSTFATVDLVGDTPPPFSSAVMIATNAWSRGTNSGARIVYAGSDGRDGTVGLIIDIYDDYTGVTSQSEARQSSVGPITFHSFDSLCGRLHFTTGEAGRPGVYLLDTRTILMGEVAPGCSGGGSRVARP